jgi:5'/3'-nucleotidase SurE
MSFRSIITHDRHTGSSDATPKARTSACQYNSCPANSGATGTNSSNTRLNWVNSYPVTSFKYGLSTFGPRIWGSGASPDLVVAGPNVGSNVYTSVPISGTVGAAVYAAHNAQLPSIAFSGASGSNAAWTTRPVPTRSLVYAGLATKLTNALIAGGKPYLPSQVWLNVNFPTVGGSCNAVGDFKFVLTRINPNSASAPDALHCGVR